MGVCTPSMFGWSAILEKSYIKNYFIPEIGEQFFISKIKIFFFWHSCIPYININESENNQNCYVIKNIMTSTKCFIQNRPQMIRLIVGELCINTQDSILSLELAEGFLFVDVTKRSVIKSGHVVGARMLTVNHDHLWSTWKSSH